MLSPSKRHSSPLALVAIVALAGVALRATLPDSSSLQGDDADSVLAGSATGGGGYEALAIEEVRGTGEEFVSPASDVVSPASDVVSAASVCKDVGYLCAALAVESEIRTYRWSAPRPQLTVLVELPEHETPEHARALRRAAVRGIQSWQNKPFPLIIQDRATTQGDEVDVRITWTSQLDGSALGTTKTRWESLPPSQGYVDVDVVLATRNPFSNRFELSTAQVELVAAHEMGHALGLPHSDRTEDLMFPTNTASRLTARDYRTVQALYKLPNGVRIRRH